VPAGPHSLLWKTAASCVALALTLAACTHGPPQLLVKVQNARLEPGGSRVAVAVYYEKNRPPTGLINTFPNGGVPKVLEREARVYLCDLETLAVTLLVAIEPSPSLDVSFNPWIAGWQDGSVILRLTGRAGTSLADYEKGLNEETYRVATGGGATLIEAVPNGLRDAGGQAAHPGRNRLSVRYREAGARKRVGDPLYHRTRHRRPGRHARHLARHFPALRSRLF